MSFEVYRVAYFGLPRDHHAIFVATNDDLSGDLFQVTGDIQNGMTFEHKPSKKPEESTSFQSRVFVGKVSAANFSRVKPICEAIPPPKKQFQGPHQLYPEEPIRRCQEWTAEALEALVNEHVLENK
ncbi:conserved hypothetical protein [Histoplasma capsulatum var. duboisii H88]|uniref:Uncharacterized protein n=1 Tax=Ajellomyces capsulatus (strain H88) TaxID=544711 RepID=F0UJT7_AJEC8|nr:conserved hypothetical protein [Histoplasma capsulatum var. duboisii H88]QSS57251.1 hypothetical protein I7I53_05673 [Histoplasma capsulatum var. duboisii H88]